MRKRPRKRLNHRPAAAILAALATFLLVTAGLLLTAGCGGKPKSDTARGTVAPEDWAGQVCKALSPWRTEIDALMIRAQHRMDEAKGPDQAKSGLVELLGGAEAASEQARAKVEAAGAPAAGNGRQVAAEFTDALRRTRDAYGNAKATVAGLPTTQAKTFYDAVAAAFGQLDREYKGLDLTKVDSPELKKAFDEVPACH